VSAFAAAFFSVANLLNIALSMSEIGIMGVGMTAVIITGGIDLSVGSGLALTGMIAGLVLQALGGVQASALGVAAALGAALAAGTLSGVFTGVTVARLRVPPFLVTLALLSIERGLAFLLTSGRSLSGFPPAFEWLGQGAVLGVPVPVWLTAIVFALGWFVLARTTWGRWVYAIGGNEEAAWLAGIVTRNVTIATYAVNGLLVGLAGVVLTARLGAAVPETGLGYELDVIAAVVVGGTALTGGRGSVLGTLIGATCIAILNNALNLANVDPYVQRIVVGVVILAAVLADRLRHRLG
jgi:ribose/xylose/arabinose/galactoside ABC-type transport system permease subunit